MSASAEAFEVERPRLIGLAYRMLGSHADADDIVQEAWLRYSAAAAVIDRPAAWLTTVVSRLAIDRLRSAQRRRETYVGPWLPDPVLDAPDLGGGPDDAVVLQESLTLGFLAVLERLSPLERAAFLLAEVFGYPLGEVAEIIGRSPEATRQLASRARRHVRDERPRYAVDTDDVEALTAAFLDAVLRGDLATLTSQLAPDVMLVSDGGAERRAARRPVIGPDRVARFLVGVAKHLDDEVEAYGVRANGQIALYLTRRGEPDGLNVFTWVAGELAAVHMVRNPTKLAAFHRAWLGAGGAVRSL